MKKFKMTALGLALLPMFFVSAEPVSAAAPETAVVQKAPYLQTVRWDAEYDVVIAGYGFAGGAAAIAAADAGARVLLLEKAPLGQEGGNSRYAAQQALWIDDTKASEADILRYFQTLRGKNTNPSDEVYKTFIAEAKKQVDYLKFLGAKDPVKSYYAEYPEYPGAAAIGLTIVKAPGGDGRLYGLIQANVKKRADKIDVWFEAPATKLLQALDPETYDVDVECGISSLVYFASKLGDTWSDAYVTSAHGRDANIVGLANTHAKVFTLLSGEDTVHAMCAQLSEYGMDVEVAIGQDFGYPSERIARGSPDELLAQSFGDLCVAMIYNGNPDRRNPIGIPDEEFVRGDAPMTKSEVRALSVAKLKLCDDSVVYDVGAGTGSVSIEMALTAVNGRVYAIEREDAAADLIEINRRKFKTPNLEVVRGLAPEAMAGLPAPTHAFIGGSSGNLRQIVQCLLEKNPDVRIVINSVTIETMAETAQVIKELGLVEEEIVNVTVARSKKLGSYHLMFGQNPVYIAVVRGR